MADSTSIYSYSDTLVNSIVESSSDTVEDAGDDILFTLILLETSNHRLDTAQLQRAGLPSSWVRSNKPHHSESGLQAPKLRKRLHIRVPRSTPLLDSTKSQPLTTIEELRNARKESNKTGKLRTIFDVELCELVGARVRSRMHAVVRLLFGSRGIRSSEVFYPSHRVRFPQNVSISGVKVQWATLIITSPSLPGDVEEQDKVAQSQALLGDLAKADEELFAKLFEPSKDAEVLLDEVLSALEARGGFWTAAAHRTRPHPRNLHPDKRSEFIVQGIFPKPFLDRCLRYRGASHCALPNDIDSDDRASLITATSAQQTASLQEADRDNLQGFTVGVTLEPINTGLPWESSGVGVMAGAAAAAGGM